MSAEAPGDAASRSGPIAACFDLARHYDRAARVQATTAASLAGRIASRYAPDAPPARILELGCGTGALTRRLRALFPAAQITAIDLSPAMIARAAGAVPDVDYRVMNAEYPELDGAFDLICSSFCIQWFADRTGAFARLAALLAPGGRLEVTTLAQGSFEQWRGACAAQGLPCGFPDYPALAQLSGEYPAALRGHWENVTQRDQVGTARQFLHDLRAIGATTPREGSRPLTATQLRRVMQHFDRTTSEMDYQIAYGSAVRTRGVFVTGTDTGIGKTLVSAILTRALDATYWKPFQTGLCDEAGDTASVTELAGLPPSRVIPPAHAFLAPLSPQDAAAQEGRSVDLTGLTLPDTTATLVVEGAGGLMVPLNDETLLVDWVATLDLPVILVCRTGLGTINHTLLSIEALRRRAIAIAGIVMSGPPSEGNRAAIEHFGQVPVLAEIPPLGTVTAQGVAAQADRIREALHRIGFGTTPM